MMACHKMDPVIHTTVIMSIARLLISDSATPSDVSLGKGGGQTRVEALIGNTRQS